MYFCCDSETQCDVLLNPAFGLHFSNCYRMLISFVIMLNMHPNTAPSMSVLVSSKLQTEQLILTSAQDSAARDYLLAGKSWFLYSTRINAVMCLSHETMTIHIWALKEIKEHFFPRCTVTMKCPDLGNLLGYIYS